MTYTLVTKLREYPVAFVGIVAAAVLAGLILASHNQLPELKLQEAELNAQLERMESNARNAENLSQHLEQARRLIEDVEERLMDLQDPTVNFRHFLALEEQFGIILSDPRPIAGPAGKPEAQKYPSIHYRITLQGTLPSCLEFVDQLRSGLYIVRINSLELAAAGSDDTVVMQVEFKVMGSGGRAG